ncbi:Zn-dependent M28 family amino/carboxypeptidase [Luteimonas sp. J16]|jgi:Zn-dependent M28 family amino/carboxypeptidase|uniref:M28 family metallopeptidase n=1 Tax=unclassified Luteimonas TaxID=2629088 RepID=UPI0004AF0FEB|nr:MULTISPECIES: M28 family metallopeptidase [unclassified Luteimonas]TWG85922.1 Zn-dependent M28 family amino/carboxypeptidase [Luteimonas sp. J16]
MRSTLILLCAGGLLLAACSRAPDAGTTAPTASTDGHAFKADIDADDLRVLVETLASDEFEGRAPGSAGEEKTVAYIQAQYERIGLEPGGDNGTYFQAVPMVETTADESTVLRLDSNGHQRELKFGTDMVLGTRTGQELVSVADSELVFVGYGVNAPEQGWNDYEGLDVKGKTVVVLVNDPGFHAGDESLFEGKRMTYYGRWTYKFEEAARQGAAAALIIHDTEGASYGWEVVRNSWSGPQFDLRPEDDPEPRIPAQGWITGEVARQLFAESGLDLDEQYAAANRRGFKPVPLKAKVSFDLRSTVSEKSSRNVVGYLRGTGAPEETVIYMAHWDHLGKHEGEGDTIYNGAVDNATGVAGIIEIAEKFAARPPRRSVVFVAVTLEESGLLGSKYYVAQPPFPLEKTVAVVNLDAMSVAGRSRDVVVTGKGNSELEDILAPLAGAQGRTLVEESNPAGGYYFRSDHFNFAKAGVPALYAKGGGDLLEGGEAAGKAASEEYARRYHQPSDEIHDGWRWDGMVEDLELLHDVGRTLADGDQWPNWYEGNPFKAARDAARAGAQ